MTFRQDFADVDESDPRDATRSVVRSQLPFRHQDSPAADPSPQRVFSST